MYKRGSNNGKSFDQSKGPKKPFGKPTGKSSSSDGRRTPKDSGDKPAYKSRTTSSRSPREEGANVGRFSDKKAASRSYSDRKPVGDRPFRKTTGTGDGASDRTSSRSYSDRKPAGDRPFRKTTGTGDGASDRTSSRSYSDRKPTGDRPFRKPTGTGDGASDRPSRSYSDRKPAGDRPFRKTTGTGDGASDRTSSRSYSDRKPTGDRPFRKTTGTSDGASDRTSSRSYSDRKPTGDRPVRKEMDGAKKVAYNREPREPRRYNAEKPTSKIGADRKPYDKKQEDIERFTKADGTVRSRSGRGPSKAALLFDKKKAQKDDKPQTGNVRLNRFIANAGVCSRREADELITAGLVTVNGASIIEMGYQVKPTDDVRYNGERLSREKKVYLLLNKPKDAITTFEDPEGRRTVMQLFGNELGERIYPVGRLDRNTTGVLLFTNDGDLAQRLMHPKYEMTKVYKATLDKNFKGEDLWTLQNGVELEDGMVKPDAIAFPDPKNKSEVGIEIHSGKNRIIHRLFEHLGYKVDKLDRSLYGGLTKGKLKRGEWRHLTEKETNALLRVVKLG